MATTLTKETVQAGRSLLPAFPRVVDELLSTLDDPDANLNLLVRHIGRDPVLAGRVFEQANSAAMRGRRDARTTELYTAVSLIGLARLRQTTICSSLSNFLGGHLPPSFWEHSATTGICAQFLAQQVHRSADAALIAGLLHDVGQLLMYRLDRDGFVGLLKQAEAGEMRIEVLEREYFGVDHGQAGAWLAEGWGLPQSVCEAIRWHHAPDPAIAEPLVPIVHVAEVLSNALDPTGTGCTHVYDISARCCEALGLTWDESATALFGHVDAVSRFATLLFRPSAAVS